MLFPLKPICEKKFIRRDGTSIIFIQYCYSMERRTLLNTEIAIPPAYWNRKQLRISGDLPAVFGNVAELNTRLTQSIRIAEDILAYAEKEKLADPMGFVKRVFRPDFDPADLYKQVPVVQEATAPVVNLDLLFQMDEYIKAKAPKVSPSMLKVYRVVKGRIAAYQTCRNKKVEFAGLDFNFYEDFVHFLTYEYVQRRKRKLIKGLRVTSIGTTIKQFRIFIRDRVRRKIIPPVDLSEFKILDEETDAIYLTWGEIQKIYDVDLSEAPHLEKYRDLFVFGCFTGLRFSDFTTIKPEDVRGRMLHKRQEKTDQRVVIPLREAAYNILVGKYKGRVPRLQTLNLTGILRKWGEWRRLQSRCASFINRETKMLPSPAQNANGLLLIHAGGHFAPMSFWMAPR